MWLGVDLINDTEIRVLRRDCTTCLKYDNQSKLNSPRVMINVGLVYR